MDILSAKSKLVPSASTRESSERPTTAVPIDWAEAMRTAVRDVGELCQMLRLSDTARRDAVAAAGEFPVFVPHGFVRKMEIGNPSDPLLRQVLPIAAEIDSVEGFTDDPLAEADATVGPGTIQKYAGRALLIMTGTCAVHCRYCFRRHFPYDSRPMGIAAWDASLARIADDASIDEVLLSGGDPLTLTDDYLDRFFARLDAIPHLRRLRIHTRLPVMIPSRVTERLRRMLRSLRMTPIIVLHINHAQEIDDEVAGTIDSLVDQGIPLLNQAVLLRGVNDQVDALVRLSRRLVDLRVMPYYLHQLDRVAGAAHFEVPVEEGQSLVRAMRRELPGYAVPRYVEERPGEPHKTVLA